ncbi:uncharacterized protein LOC118144429 [Callithrix jacchus]
MTLKEGTSKFFSLAETVTWQEQQKMTLEAPWLALSLAPPPSAPRCTPSTPHSRRVPEFLWEPTAEGEGGGEEAGLRPYPRSPTHLPPGSRPALGQTQGPGGGSGPAPRRAETAWAAAAAGTIPGNRGSVGVLSGYGAGRLWLWWWQRRRPLAADVAPDATRPLHRLLSSRLLPRLRLRGARALVQPGPLPRPPGTRPLVSRRVRSSQQPPAGRVLTAHARRSKARSRPFAPCAPPWEPPAGLSAPPPGVSPPSSRHCPIRSGEGHEAWETRRPRTPGPEVRRRRQPGVKVRAE